MSRWLADKVASVLAARTDRRGMLVKSAVVGSALAVNPLDYVLKPVSAYAAACACRGACSCGSLCCDGYTEFCCTITGSNTCPQGTIPAGWWKADGTGFCDGPRYYMDCNQTSYACGCGCANGSCDNRGTCCNFFRYGQCHQEVASVGAIVCRVVTCTPPWVIDGTCTTVSATDQATAFHDAPCLHAPPPPPTRLVTAQWFLRKSPSTGVSDISFIYGSPGDLPIVGDWDGDGKDGIGVVRGNTFYLRNSLSSGVADIVFSYGNVGDQVVTGKWTKNATADTIGVVRGNTFYLRNSNSTGVADIVFSYGDVGDKVLMGDWDGDGVDTPCVVRDTTYYARNSNSSGFADLVFSYGDHNDLRLVGKWAASSSKVEGPGVAR